MSALLFIGPAAAAASLWFLYKKAKAEGAMRLAKNKLKNLEAQNKEHLLEWNKQVMDLNGRIIRRDKVIARLEQDKKEIMELIAASPAGTDILLQRINSLSTWNEEEPDDPEA